MSSHPFEPSTILSDGDGVCVTVHNAFDVEVIRRIAETGGAATSISGNEYDTGRMMRLLAFAVSLRPDVDISYLEGRMAVEALREADAFSPETAVRAEDLGFRRIPASMSRSKRLSVRVAYTEDGRAYLETKGNAAGSADCSQRKTAR